MKSREELGQLVRKVWIEWARQQPDPKPSWLVPWEQLSEADKEVDRRIGEVLFTEGMTQAADVCHQLSVAQYVGSNPLKEGLKRGMSEAGIKILEAISKING